MKSGSENTVIRLPRKAIEYYLRSLSPYPVEPDRAQYYFTHGRMPTVYEERGIECGVGAWLRSWFCGEWSRDLLDLTARCLGATTDDFLLISEALEKGERPFVRPSLLVSLAENSLERMHLIVKQAFGAGSSLSQLVSAETVSRCLPRDAYRYYYGELTDGELYFLLSDMARYIMDRITQEKAQSSQVPLALDQFFGTMWGVGDLTDCCDQLWSPEDGYFWEDNDT